MAHLYLKLLREIAKKSIFINSWDNINMQINGEGKSIFCQY